VEPQDVVDRGCYVYEPVQQPSGLVLAMIRALKFLMPISLPELAMLLIKKHGLSSPSLDKYKYKYILFDRRMS